MEAKRSNRFLKEDAAPEALQMEAEAAAAGAVEAAAAAIEVYINM